MNHRGVGTKEIIFPNGKRDKTVEVDMSELTKNTCQGLHRESSNKEDEYVVLSRKNSRGGDTNCHVIQIKIPQRSNQNIIPRQCHCHHLRSARDWQKDCTHT